MEAAITFITLFLVCGITAISYFFFKSKERQSLIEKGLAPEQIHALYYRKPLKTGNVLLKIGVIIVFFGIGLGIGGPFVDKGNEYEMVMPTSLFVSTGIGFILANILGKKADKKDEVKE